MLASDLKYQLLGLSQRRVDILDVGKVGADLVDPQTHVTDPAKHKRRSHYLAVIGDVNCVWRMCHRCAEICVAADVFEDAFGVQTVANRFLVDAGRFAEQFTTGRVDLPIVLPVKVFRS